MPISVLIFFIITIAAGLYFLFLAFINMVWMKKETKADSLTEGPFLSVLVPARNEEIHIGPCIESLMNQTYKNYEVLVIDDNSTDTTAEILQNLKNKYQEKLCLFKGQKLEDGWRGKPFALHQLCSKAKGELLLFTDADTIHSSRSLSLAVSNMQYHNVDFLSGYIRQRLVTFGEKITVPVVYILSFFLFPLWVCKKSNSPLFAAAVGQYICVNKKTFLRTGGFSQVKNVTTEDVYLARSMKKQGAKTIFLDLKDAAICRMYYSYKDCIVGIGKNIFDFLGKNSIMFVFAIICVVVFLIVPPFVTISFAVAFLMGMSVNATIFLAVLVNTLCMYFAWLIVFISQQLRKRYTLLYPLIFINLLYIAIFSWYRSITKQGHEWKGRIVH